MFRKAVSALLAFCMLFMLSACDSGGEESSSEMPPTVSAAPEGPPLRVCSYNINAGIKAEFQFNLLIDDICEKDPDVIGLQEVDRFARRSGFVDTVKMFSELSDYDYYAYFVATDIGGTDERRGDYGLGILSKYPILSTEQWDLESGKEEQRILARAEIEVSGERVQFFVTHLGYEVEGIRLPQYEQLNNTVSGFEGLRILVGDFNFESFEEIASVTALTPVVKEENPLTTYPTENWFTSPDNIMYSDGLTLKNSFTHAGHSDHNLLFADFTLPYRGAGTADASKVG